MSRAKESWDPAASRSLVGELMQAGREMGAATVMFHSAVAEHAGLSATEHKAMDILSRAGPVTAGELAEHTGLTSGAITGLVDRLEAAGLARRVRDPQDRRKVIIEPVHSELERVIGPRFAEVGQAVAELYASYDEEAQALILDYTRRMTALLHEQTLKLRGSG